MGSRRKLRTGVAGWLAAALSLWLALAAAPAAASMSAARLVDPLGEAPVCSAHAGRHAPSPDDEDCAHCLHCCGAPAALIAPPPPALPLPAAIAYAPPRLRAWAPPRGSPVPRPRVRDPPLTA